MTHNTSKLFIATIRVKIRTKKTMFSKLALSPPLLALALNSPPPSWTNIDKISVLIKKDEYHIGLNTEY
ncbi:hypothetical protein JCM33374_g2633 [Metschnikowia sp. JCM 33374]|nr:hypothetical protein JCM33374_g2633 [Metschnikowia sp. JCM 33374]